MEKIKYYMAGICLVIFSNAYSQNIATEELGISQQEYQEIIINEENKKQVLISKKYILTSNKNILENPLFFIKKDKNIDKNCLVEPVIIPMINYKEDEKE